jgi:uncharacterized membrane protein
MKKYRLLVFFLAFIIRLIALNQSLWLDEATTAKVVKDYSYLGIITKFSPFDFHPPLYYLLMKLWTGFFGDSEIALRFPSVIFSLLTGWFVYLIGGIWAAAFFLFNPLIVYYSQEARMYMMATFFLTGALYFLISNIKYQKSKLHIKNQILFNLFIFLSLSTFYGSIFLVAAFLIYLLYKRQYKHFLICLFVIFVYFLLASPLLLKQFANAQKSLNLVLNWKLVLGTVSLKNLLLLPIKFSFGRISFYPKWLYWGVLGVWGFLVWFFVVAGGIKNRLLFYLFLGPLVIGLLFSFFTPLLQYFRFLYLIPVMSLLLAKGTKITIYQPARPAGGYIIIGGFFILSFVYLLNPQFHRENWKSLAASLSQDKPVYMIVPSSDALRYYRPEIRIIDWRFNRNHFPNLNELVIIPYTADIYGFDYKKEIEKKGFTFKERRDFGGVWYEIWVKNKDYAGSFLYSLRTARI